MSASLVRMGPTKVRILDTVATFTPVGKVYEVGDTGVWHTDNARENPLKYSDKKPRQGARIMLGFNVGIEEKVTLDEVVDLVFSMRKKQVNAAIKAGEAKPHPLGGDIGASFLSQYGLWQSREDDKPYPEKGVQVVMMNVISEHARRFRKDMIDIAEEMVVRFRQNAVIIEMSKRGVVDETLEIGP